MTQGLWINAIFFIFDWNNCCMKFHIKFQDVVAMPELSYWTTVLGQARAQVISSQFIDVTAQILAQVMCNLCGQSDTAAGFLQVLRFLQHILIPSTAPCSSFIQSFYSQATTGQCTHYTQLNWKNNHNLSLIKLSSLTPIWRLLFY
jgi:hypothetical protein